MTSSVAGWTIKTYVCPTAWDGNNSYVIDRGNQTTNSGFAFGFARYSQTVDYYKPCLFSEGTKAQTGATTYLNASSGRTNCYINAWAHIAVVKLASDDANLYFYPNGTSCGSVAVGTNYTSGASWSQITLGKSRGIENI